MRFTDNKVKMTVHFIDICQNTEKVIESIDSLISSHRYDIDLEMVHVKDNEQAKELKFRGSPTIYINGEDVLPWENESDAIALSCRYYPDGPPNLEFLEQYIDSLHP